MLLSYPSDGSQDTAGPDPGQVWTKGVFPHFRPAGWSLPAMQCSDRLSVPSVAGSCTLWDCWPTPSWHPRCCSAPVVHRKHTDFSDSPSKHNFQALLQIETWSSSFQVTITIALLSNSSGVLEWQYLSAVPGHGRIDKHEAARAVAEPAVWTDVITSCKENSDVMLIEKHRFFYSKYKSKCLWRVKSRSVHLNELVSRTNSDRGSEKVLLNQSGISLFSWIYCFEWCILSDYRFREQGQNLLLHLRSSPCLPSLKHH